ncbi:hypothetical protein EMCG_04552 [[Emmonsia] crescens]|uniref:Uncharacterized protein n=1 Tax=[Emmonsia] crescens TaxID=73230 RepID=A0A0G2HRW4_9EURO|nr:hypothetical protein EMCG_04552 [Emmonsia crescens UAMH 3008]
MVFQCCELMYQLRMDHPVERALNTLFHRLKLDPIEPQEVYHIEDTVWAKDHPDRLSSHHTLAMAYQANG